MELTCYVHEGWAPRIRPASPKRDWMEATPERFAYRCLPLAIANAHGWEIGSPCAFEARWHGGSGAEAIEIRVDAGTPSAHAPVSLFGQGTITFHVEGILRTSPGWNLWVGGHPNAAKDGIAPLGGVIETDWSPYTFTMNWRFTRPGAWVRWERDEPFCFFFPVQRGVLEAIEPTLRPLADEPALQAAFKTWSASRDAFHEHVRTTRPAAPADKWQKLYFRGLGPDGAPGAADHAAKLRLAPFAAAADRPTPSSAPPPAPAASCPVAMPPPAAPAIFANPPAPAPARAGLIPDETMAYTLRTLGFDAQPRPAAPARGMVLPRPRTAPPPAAPSAPAPVPDRGAAHAAWILAAAERQRALSPRAGAIPRVRAPSSDEFLDRFYAAARPVVIEGALGDWPALVRWTPAYLRDAVGSAPIDYQGGRDASPEFELYKDDHTRRMPFDRYIDMILRAGPGNDAYVTAYNSAANRAALAPLHRDLGALDAYLAPGEGMVWIGPAGTFTPLHFDLTNNLVAQIVGRKRLVLLPPSETPRLANTRHVFSDVHDIADPARLARFPLAREALRYEVELAPGDLLYVPFGWWHQVTALEFSVTLTYTGFRWPNDAHATYPAA